MENVESPTDAVKYPGRPRFLADHMLGRLARWLRALGYDTEFDPGLDDPHLALKAAREGRVLLTRDRELVKRRLVRQWVLIESGDIGSQLRQVIRERRLPRPAVSLCRCMVCNGEIVTAHAGEAAAHVPPYVARTQDRFFRCTRCGRHYWAGTHVRNMREKLDKMLDEAT